MKSAALTFFSWKLLIFNNLNMIKEFNYKGHHFKVVAVENSTDYIIIRDGRQTRRVKEEIADKAIEYVDKLFD